MSARLAPSALFGLGGLRLVQIHELAAQAALSRRALPQPRAPHVRHLHSQRALLLPLQQKGSGVDVASPWNRRGIAVASPLHRPGVASASSTSHSPTGTSGGLGSDWKGGLRAKPRACELRGVDHPAEHRAKRRGAKSAGCLSIPREQRMTVQGYTPAERLRPFNVSKATKLHCPHGYTLFEWAERLQREVRDAES